MPQHARAVVLGVGPELDDTLTHDHEALHDPIERAAVEDLVAPPRRLQGAVAEFRRLAFARQPPQPLSLPVAQILDRLDPDTELDEMHGHVSAP